MSGYDVIVVEDLDLRGMGGALSLGKNLHDNGFGMFRQMLAYKLRRKGSCLVKVTAGSHLQRPAAAADMSLTALSFPTGRIPARPVG